LKIFSVIIINIEGMREVFKTQPFQLHPKLKKKEITVFLKLIAFDLRENILRGIL